MPRTLSVEEYKELGKRYYGRRDYERARDAFTDGIDASTGRNIQLYDYRAATFDKLGDASAALADARYMIKNFEKDPKVRRDVTCFEVFLDNTVESKAHGDMLDCSWDSY